MSGIKPSFVFSEYVGKKIAFKTGEITHMRSLSINSLTKRNDAIWFKKIAVKFNSEKDLSDFMISVFIDNPDAYIRDVFLDFDRINKFHQTRMKYINSFDVFFEDDIETLINANMTIKELFNVQTLVGLYLKHKIKLETLAALQIVFKWVRMNAVFNPLYTQICTIILVYSKFIPPITERTLKSVENLTNIKFQV